VTRDLRGVESLPRGPWPGRSEVRQAVTRAERVRGNTSLARAR